MGLQPSAEHELTLLPRPRDHNDGDDVRTPRRRLAAAFALGIVLGVTVTVLCFSMTFLPSLGIMITNEDAAADAAVFPAEDLASAAKHNDTLKPMVSICIVTLASRCKYFGTSMVRNMQRSTYPAHRLELLVLNQGNETCVLPEDARVRYTFRNTSQKDTPLMNTGMARNQLLDSATGDVIVAMDDDDIYGAEYIDFMLGNNQSAHNQNAR